MKESFENVLFDVLDYFQPESIIKICTKFENDFFSEYCNNKNITFNVIDYNFNVISPGEEDSLLKNFAVEEFSFSDNRNILIFENNSSKSKCWEDVEKIFKLISMDNFSMIFFVGFLDLKLDDKFINGDLINSYNFLERLVLFSEQANFDLSLSINSSDVCCLYQYNEEINQIFENHISEDLKESYFNQLLFKELEIIKFKNEISELKILNSQWIDRNSVLTKTKEDLFIQNEFLNQKNDELIELNSQWINRNSILSKTKNELLSENQKLSKNIEDIKLKLDETNIKLSNIKNESKSTDEDLFKKKSEELNLKLMEKDNIIKNYENKIKVRDSEMEYKDSLIQGLEGKLSLKESQINNFESKLSNKDNEISNLQMDLERTEGELSLKESQINNFESELSNKDNEISNLQMDLERTESSVNLFKNTSNFQLSKLNSKDYCIKCFKDEIENNHVELNYLKHNSIVRKIFSPFSYVVLCLKSTPKDLKLNFKLYKAFKNSKCFDIGYYLKNNEDICQSKWCKFFSPELHYICYGFDEKRKFNKKYYNRNSKKDLLDYILNCH